MSFSRRTVRRAKHDYERLRDGGSQAAGPDDKPVHVLGSSHIEIMAALRAMPMSPAAPGSPSKSWRHVP